MNFIFVHKFPINIEITYTVPGPEFISRREEYVAASLAADFLPAPGRPIKITPLKLVPKAQLKPEINIKRNSTFFHCNIAMKNKIVTIQSLFVIIIEKNISSTKFLINT